MTTKILVILVLTSLLLLGSLGSAKKNKRTGEQPQKLRERTQGRKEAVSRRSVVIDEEE
jgi:hypothetical protein